MILKGEMNPNVNDLFVSIDPMISKIMALVRVLLREGSIPMLTMGWTEESNGLHPRTAPVPTEPRLLYVAPWVEIQT